MILEKSQNPAIMADQIQQLAGMIKGADEASEIDYDNTESGLTAENVQAALDELAGITAVQSEASGIEYDNTDSGLEAEDVQEALDEINEKANKALGTIIEEIASGGDYSTYTLALTKLETAFNALSNDDKRNTRIYSGNAVLSCSHITDKIFNFFQIASNETAFFSLDLKNHKYMRVIINNTSGAVTYDDLSSNTHAGITLLVK